MSEPIPSPPQATPECPWLGLAHFTPADHDFFYGRKAEVLELTDRVRRAPLTVLYGVSGYGKSSLLGAGLIPSLAEDGFTVTLLRRCYESLAERSLVEDVIGELMADHPEAVRAESGESATLWEFFHDRRQPWSLNPDQDDGISPRPVLILDQFEEIFTRGEDRNSGDRDGDSFARQHARDFLRQLADLVENRPPAALRQRLESGTTAEKREILGHYDFQSRPVRCVLALRDDFLARLERWRREMPGIMEHRVELRLLSGTQAFHAVFDPGTKRPGKPPLIPREAAEEIVRTVARVPAETPLSEIRAVPSLLSLLCEQLNSARLAADASQIDTEMVSSRTEDILHHFYEDSFTVLPASHREKVREVVEDRMVTDGGHRHPVAREAAEETLLNQGVPDPGKAIDELIHRRLLTAEDQKGVPLLEITHDVLLPLIIRSRKERRERVQEEKRKEERKAEMIKTRKRRQLMLSMLLLTGAAVAGAMFGLYHQRSAEFERDVTRYHEGLGWQMMAEYADERGRQFPGTLLYAGTAIGFEGAGRPESTAYLRHDDVKKRATFRKSLEWIRQRPCYLPVWSSATGGPPLHALAVDLSGRYVATGGVDTGVTVWDLSSQDQMLNVENASRNITDLVFNPDGSGLMIAGDNGYHLWRPDLAEVTAVSGLPATALACSPDGHALVVAGSSGSLTVMRKGTEALEIPGKFPGGSRTAFSADNSVAAATSSTKGITVFFPWSVAVSNAWSSEAVATLHADTTAVAVSPDGKLLATGDQSGSIRIWDLATTARLSSASPDQQHAGPVRDLCFRGDGLQLASCGEDGFVKLWNLSEPSLPPAICATLTGHAGAVDRVRYLPGGELLASCGSDGSARIWNVSKAASNHTDLYRYVAEQWYIPALEKKIPSWGGKTGFIALPSNSLPRYWQQPSPEPLAFEYLVERGDKAGAISLLSRVPEERRRAATARIHEELVRRCQLDAGAGRWNLVDLSLRQWDASGGGQNSVMEELRTRRATFATEGKSFANSHKIELIWCPAGTFTMGSPPEESQEAGRQPDDQRQRVVNLTSGFWIGKFEVKQQEWLDVMGGDNLARYKKISTSQPLESITWDQAMEFCRKLTDLERSRGTIPAGWEYSLPTEAQWEYACRAENQGAYCFGNDRGLLAKYGNFRDRRYAESLSGKNSSEPSDETQDDGFDVTCEVGHYLPNKWLIHDMHGNVMEWCRDRFNMSVAKLPQTGPAAPVTDPIGLEGDDRKIRGGSWKEHPKDCRSARGFGRPPTSSTPEIGMRVALVRVRPEK